MFTFPLLRDRLAALTPGTPVLFATADADIRGGYLLTEVTLADVKGLNCAGERTAWQEAGLHLLDGFGGDLMPSAKLGGILGAALAQMPELAEAPLHVVFAPRNQGAHRYEIAKAEMRDGVFRIRLRAAVTICKAVQPSPKPAAKACCAKHLACCS